LPRSAEGSPSPGRIRAASPRDRLPIPTSTLHDSLSRVLVEDGAEGAQVVAFLTARAPDLGPRAAALNLPASAVRLLDPILALAEREARLLGATRLVVEGVPRSVLAPKGFETTASGWTRELAQAADAPLAERFLHAAAAAARAAAEAIAGLEREQAVAVGADGAPTEAADRAAEGAALLHLLELGLPVVSEEAGVVGPMPAADEPWISLDPLDGSRNFRAALPPFATAVGLVWGSVVVAGLVREHTGGRLWWSARGSGTFVDGAPVQPGASRLLAVPSTRGRPPAPPPGFDRIRVSGSTSIDLCHVADGSLAGYRGADPAVAHVHDLVPGIVMIEEMGGVVLSARDGEAPALLPDPAPTLPIVAAGHPGDARALLKSLAHVGAHVEAHEHRGLASPSLPLSHAHGPELGL
jgi:3'(2'), 5'-bisphosphate nucleotidase